MQRARGDVGPSSTGADEAATQPDGSHQLGGGANGFRARARSPRRRSNRSKGVIETRLPETVAGFIRDHVTSVEQLEVLLLLRGQSHRLWTAEELSGELKTTADSVEQRLASLERAGLAGRENGAFRFASDRAAIVDAVASCYAARRVAVIEAIFTGERETGLIVQ